LPNFPKLQEKKKELEGLRSPSPSAALVEKGWWVREARKKERKKEGLGICFWKLLDISYVEFCFF
jgi:hypothetical protein